MSTCYYRPPQPLLSQPPLHPTYLVADIKAPKMLNRVWASIFAMWLENLGEELAKVLSLFDLSEK